MWHDCALGVPDTQKHNPFCYPGYRHPVIHHW